MVQPSPLVDFLAGGVGAVTSITLTHPLDVVKSRQQFVGELGSGGKRLGVWNGLHQLATKEGFKGLYGGLMPAWGLQFSVTATRFGVYGLFQHLSPTIDEERSFWGDFTKAAVAGAVGGALGSPWFALKTRNQVFSRLSGNQKYGTQHEPKRVWESFKQMRSEGTLFRGVDAFVPRVVVYGAVQLSVYDALKRFSSGEAGQDWGRLGRIAPAVCAAVCSVSVIQPFDTIAARLMNQPVLKPIYSSALDAAYKVTTNEGLSGLFKGFSGNLARFIPYSALVLVLVDEVKDLVIDDETEPLV